MIAELCAGLLACEAAASDARPARCEEIWTVNAVDVRPGRWDEARRYYQAGWIPAREEAVRRGVIAGYRLVASGPDAEAPQIQLITVYADRAQFEAREANFEAIFAASGVPRPLRIDGLGRDEIVSATRGDERYMESFGSGGCVGAAAGNGVRHE